MAIKKATRKAVPYLKIAALVQQNFTAIEIAEKLDRKTKGSDVSHGIRAIISRMRTHGYKNAEGKTVKLKVKRVGTVPVKKVKPATKKALASKPETKAAAAGQN